jgi:hypothetical protein
VILSAVEVLVYCRSVRASTLLLVLAVVLLASTAVAGATGHEDRLVQVHGSVTYGITSSIADTYAGGACSVVVTSTVVDTLTYATPRPVRIASPHPRHVEIPYTLTLHPGSTQVGAPSGTMPDGSACAPLDPPRFTDECGDYHGTIPLVVELDAHKLTVSSPGRGFPSKRCGGGNVAQLWVPATTAALPASGTGRTAGRADHTTTSEVCGGTVSSHTAAVFGASVAPG